MTEELKDAQAIIDIALAAAPPTPIEEGGFYAALVPQGYTIATVDDRDKADRRADRPRRRQGTVHLTRQDSFSQFVQDRRTPEAMPDLYADAAANTLTAIFNPGTEGQPGWNDDRVVLNLTHTPEWLAWTTLDRQQVSQVKFAEFIEDNRADVVNPDGATLLEMVQEFEATTNVEFRSAQRLQNGQRQVTYVEKTEGRTTAGAAGGMIEFPGAFTLAIPIFDGLDPTTIEARVRYRVASGNLTIGFVLDDTDRLETEAFDAVLAAVEQDTGLRAYHGTPA